MGKKLLEMTLDELWQLFPIFLTEHKSYWTNWYNEEVEILKKFLPTEILYHHIGSTAIKGIMAKPIIDILIVAVSDEQLKQVALLMQKHGYIIMSTSKNRISLNKGYTKDGFAEKVFHFHLRLNGDIDEIYFRDYLNSHPSVAKDYEQLKLCLSKKYKHNRDAYTDAKTEFITKYTNLAKDIKMDNILTFTCRQEFRDWLCKNCLSHDGVWLLFEKTKASKIIKAEEALEEALCFGWIDGQMQRIDEKTYKKYFSQRRTNSKWSEKNKALVKSLEERNLMTNFGMQKVNEAKQNGQWNAPKAPAITDEQINNLSTLLIGHEPAYTNFQEMSLSVKRTYTKAYLDAKTDSGREKRFAWMIDRLNKNLKPM